MPDIYKQILQARRVYTFFQEEIGTKKVNAFLLTSSLILTFVFLRSCGFYQSKKPDTKNGVPVLVTIVQKKDFPLYLNAIGTVASFGTVTVKTQINGYLQKIYIDEGQMVKKGQLLAQIDSRPYEAALKQAEGQLLRDEALLENARLDLKRYRVLMKEDSLSRQALDTQFYLVKQYEGLVKVDQGTVDTAKTNLQYCKIISEIDGKSGLQDVDEGNYIQTSDTIPITTINIMDPILVTFPIPEDDLAQVQEQFQKNPSLVVEAYDRANEKLLTKGNLVAIDSQINTATGTINLRAQFSNTHYRLYPNQFVNVRLMVEMLRDALIIPTSAIQTGTKGPFVYVLDPEKKTVSAKYITIKTTVGDDSAVTGDIAVGQTIVTQGQDKLTEGTLVTPHSSAAAA